MLNAIALRHLYAAIIRFDDGEPLRIDREVFEECLASGKFADHIEKDLQDAVSSGGSGTPYMVIIAPNNKKMGLSGAQPYETIRQVVEILLPE